jgi:glycosyltransferase involved in cell wall biosynthesis
MSDQVEISICIPAFKRADYLRRLLDSIVLQSFRNFEVIIADDSPGDEVEQLSQEYSSKVNLRYHRNTTPAGTPENWNIALDLARGEWIKIMHDDDWFTGENSLQDFKTAIDSHPSYGFFFAAYNNVSLNTHIVQPAYSNGFRNRLLKKSPASLVSRNTIGPPSVVIHKSNIGIRYDKSLKWLVDIDFYIRALDKTAWAYIEKPLINVGIGQEQVTRDCFRQRPIEIPENFYLLNKVGVSALKNIMVYDAWWRLMRNLEIKKKEEIVESGYPGPIPQVVLSMIRWQARLPNLLLKTGLFSKAIMSLHYICNFGKISS